MMNLISQYIKNIIKIKFQILATIIVIVFMIILHANNNINQKQKTLNDINAEILNLDKDIDFNADLQKDANKQIKEIASNLENLRKQLLNERNQKEIKEELLQKSNFILDSLNNNLAEVINNQNKVKVVIQNNE